MRHKKRPDRALRLDHFLPYRLSVLAAAVSRRFADEYEKSFGLTIPEWRVMAVLGFFKPMSSNRIVEHTSMDKAKVSRAVARLVRRGLLTRRSHPEDGRLLVLGFSPKGRRIYRRIARLAKEWEAWLVAGLLADDRRRLARTLGALTRRLHRDRTDGLFRRRGL